MMWPSSLPPLLLQLSRDPRVNVVSFGTDVGPGKVRRRSTANGVAVSGALFLTVPQVTEFESFFLNDLQSGSLTFEMADPFGKANRSWRFDPSSPYRMTRVTPSRWRAEVNLMSV